MPDRRLISSGSDFERQSAYSRAVVDGDRIHVAGTTGFDYEQMTIAEGVVEQTEQAFRNIIAALEEADATLADVVRVRYIVPDPVDFAATWPVLRQYFGEVRPAATMLSCGLADPRMRIEIEVTAHRDPPPPADSGQKEPGRGGDRGGAGSGYSQRNSRAARKHEPTAQAASTSNGSMPGLWPPNASWSAVKPTPVGSTFAMSLISCEWIS